MFHGMKPIRLSLIIAFNGLDRAPILVLRLVYAPLSVQIERACILQGREIVDQLFPFLALGVARIVLS